MSCQKVPYIHNLIPTSVYKAINLQGTELFLRVVKISKFEYLNYLEKNTKLIV